MSNFVGDNDHGDAVPDYNHIMDEHVRTVYKLTRERDSARRVICGLLADPTGSQESGLVVTEEDIAKEHGWDYLSLDTLQDLDQELGL